MKQHFSIVTVVFLALAASCQMLAQAGNAQPEVQTQSRNLAAQRMEQLRKQSEPARKFLEALPPQHRRVLSGDAQNFLKLVMRAGEIEGELGQGLPNRGLGPSRAGAKTQALPLSAAGDHGQGLIPVFSSHSGFLTFQEHVQSRFDGSTII